MPDFPRSFSAAWVVPIANPPIRRGTVWVDGDGTILRYGPEVQPAVNPSENPSENHSETHRANHTDLGDVAILPALINAHTHLEFSGLSQPVGHPGIALASWIGLAMGARQNTDATMAASGRSNTDVATDPIALGLAASREVGVGLIADMLTITSDPAEGVAGSSPTAVRQLSDFPRTISFGEVLGLSAKRFEDRLSSAVSRLAVDATAGLSPHAPYSLTQAGFNRVVESAVRHDRPLAMHLAESAAERDLIFEGRGPFAEALRGLGVWNDDVFPWPDAGEDYCGMIAQLSRAPRGLIVHGNDLTDREIRCIAQFPNLSVVYCPRTHHFFEHPPHPIGSLMAAGIRVAIGTDSLASNPDLSVWGELQYLLNHRRDLEPADLLRAVTLDAAEALGQPEMGRIEVGCRPGLISVSTSATDPQSLYESFAVGDQPVFIPACNPSGE